MRERFLKFGDVREDKHVGAIPDQVLDFLEACECSTKVIAQCYDGAVMAKYKRKSREKYAL